MLSNDDNFRDDNKENGDELSVNSLVKVYDMEKYINVLPKGTELHNGKRKYRVEKVLGTGGFGITYKVSSTVMVDNVAINTFFAMKEYFLSSCYRDNDGATMRFSPTMKIEVEQSLNDFITEAKRLNSLGLKSDNIVKVNEVFKENGTAYYIMEYLEGGNLQDFVKTNGALSEADAVALITPIAHAVEALHSERILHLDIKPENIVLKEERETGEITPILIDFGLVKHFDSKGKPTTRLSAKGASDGYAPMEQYTTIDKFTPAIDVYALGATLFYLIKGKNPPKAFDIESSITIEKSLPAMISENVKMTIVHAMEKSKFERTSNVTAFLAELGNKEDDFKDERKTKILPNYRSKMKVGYPKVRKMVWGVVIIALVFGIFLFVFNYFRSNTIKSLYKETKVDSMVVDSIASYSINEHKISKDETLTEKDVATLTVNCPTKGAKIYINNRYMDIAPWKGDLSPGKYTVEAKLDNYISQKNTIQLAKEDNKEVDLKALVFAPGQLRANYQPNDAEVWIDGKLAGHSGEIIKNITVGKHSVVIRGNSKPKKLTFEDGIAIDKEYLPESKTIVVNDDKLITISGTLKGVDKIVEDPNNPPVYSQAYAEEPLRRDFFFVNRKWDVRKSEQQKIQDIVDYMKRNPNAKLDIAGYDSKEDGNSDSDIIASNRANEVLKLIIGYGIARSRITVQSRGSRVQPFADPDSNRVVICVAE